MIWITKSKKRKYEENIINHDTYGNILLIVLLASVVTGSAILIKKKKII